jgi:hypothetical protein
MIFLHGHKWLLFSQGTPRTLRTWHAKAPSPTKSSKKYGPKHRGSALEPVNDDADKPAMSRSAIRSPTRGAVGALVAVVMGVTLDEFDDINASSISAPNNFRD